MLPLVPDARRFMRIMRHSMPSVTKREFTVLARLIVNKFAVPQDLKLKSEDSSDLVVVQFGCS